MESYHLKREGLLPEVSRSPKGDGQVDLPEGFRLFPWYDTMKWCPTGSEAHVADAHRIKGLSV